MDVVYIIDEMQRQSTMAIKNFILDLISKERPKEETEPYATELLGQLNSLTKQREELRERIRSLGYDVVHERGEGSYTIRHIGVLQMLQEAATFRYGEYQKILDEIANEQNTKLGAN